MSPKKILVVDDEESIRSLFSAALTHKGYTVYSAESGEKALELLEDEPISVMFLDLNLPGINGIELCREVIRKSPDTIAYAVTGYSSNYKSAECRTAGFSGYFSKPMPLDQLWSAAEEAFTSQPAGN